jgi:hypothetical protein
VHVTAIDFISSRNCWLPSAAVIAKCELYDILESLLRCRSCHKRLYVAESDGRRRWAAVCEVLDSARVAGNHFLEDRQRPYNSFTDFFVGKIRTVKAKIKSQLEDSSTDALYAGAKYIDSSLDALFSPMLDEVKTDQKNAAKSSPVDYILTLIIKSCKNLFAPLVAHLTPSSFRDVSFPAT